MSSNMPAYNPDALKWLEALIDQWAAGPAAIGVTSAMIADLNTDITTARDAFTTVQHVRAEAKASTSFFHESADDMRRNAAAVISTIKAFADTSSSRSAIYTAAGLTPASNPTPLPTPGQPSNLLATLQQDGSITLTWDGKGPTGTVYQVYRQLAGEDSFVIVGAAGARLKSFNDQTVPRGSASVTYMVRAQHADKFSLYSPVTTAQFGKTSAVASGKMGTAAGKMGEAVKAAA